MSTKQQRKTATRKARQVAAIAMLRKVNPGGAFVRVRRGYGNMAVEPLTDPSMLRERAKQVLVEGFKARSNG